MEQMKMRSKGSAVAEAVRQAHGVEADTEDMHWQAVGVASKTFPTETLALRKRWLTLCKDMGARRAAQEGNGCAQQVRATAREGRAAV